jgi:hypothetical protein
MTTDDLVPPRACLIQLIGATVMMALGFTPIYVLIAGLVLYA